MDEQSGTLNKQGKCKSDNKSGWQNEYVGGGGVNAVERKLYLDSGGASRFFYVAKASKSERNKGLDDFEEKPLAFSNQAKAELKRGNSDFDGGDAKGHGNSIRHLKNFHPTVKPVKLMQYLVRLVTPHNGIVLDPFCGSGTTGIACKIEGFEFVGMEQDPEYSKIAESRISNWVEEKEKTKDKKTDNQDNPNFTQASLF
jgi:site-specific DNA-methyltransferase (adenine-specific)